MNELSKDAVACVAGGGVLVNRMVMPDPMTRPIVLPPPIGEVESIVIRPKVEVGLVDA